MAAGRSARTAGASLGATAGPGLDATAGPTLHPTLGPTVRPTLREALREATAAAHRRLDDRLGLHDVATLAGHTGFLAAIGRALLPLEQALSTAGIERLLPDWAERRRSEAILSDLRRLGAPDRTLPADALHADWIDDEASMLGAAYVLEGSRLGAALLGRRAARSAEPRIAAGRFLAHGQGPDLWRGFLAVLDGRPSDPGEQARACRSAVLSFALFERAAATGEEG